MKQRLFDRVFLPAQVVAVDQHSTHLRRIAVTGEALRGLSWLPGQHVRVQVGPSSGVIDWLIGVLRTYTVWDYHDETMELLVFDHGGGPGANWSKTTVPGDELMLLKPDGSFTVAPASYHLFAGEETAQAAYGPMLRHLTGDTKVFARLEVDTPDEKVDIAQGVDPASANRWDLDWSFRYGRSAASSETLVEEVRRLKLPAEPGHAYLAGEARTIQMVRRHLVEERGWPRRNVRTKPYWTPGRKGMD